jgi:carbamoyltransferase
MVDVLGISALYHDAAAALVRDGEVVAAVQQERFSRRKHDAAFPHDAIAWCLEAGGSRGIDAVAYYDKPLNTFERVLRSFASAGPRGFTMFPRALGEWSHRKLWIGLQIERSLRILGQELRRPVLYAEHHVSHAAAAFYPSPFAEAAIITLDGVGEWATSSIGLGQGRTVELLRELHFPDSLGLLYAAFTAHCGFKVNSGEYKLMGLAPFGEPVYAERILSHLVDLADDGSFRLDLRYFDFLGGRRMTNRHFDALFDGPAREPEAALTQRECDLARSVQVVTEEAVLRIARTARDLTGQRHAVLAGGVALNCTANGRLSREGIFDEIWVQPAAGDAGSSLGAALWAYHQVLAHPRRPAAPDGMHGTYLGPRYAAEEIASELDRQGRPHERIADDEERARRVAALVADGAVVGVFQGGMEFGPRALGNRSILADARDPNMQRRLNRRVKKREGFRPFAPAVLEERADDWFELRSPSPYMSLVAPVRGGTSEPVDRDGGDRRSALDLAARVGRSRSRIPAATHVDGSARVQTVSRERAPHFHRLLAAFEELTGCPVVLNTSFNVRGEPIVCTPDDAYRCFMTTDLDWLVLEDCLLDRAQQPAWTGSVPTMELD